MTVSSVPSQPRVISQPVQPAIQQSVQPAVQPPIQPPIQPAIQEPPVPVEAEPKAVKFMERALTAAGFNPGKIDTRFDRKTAEALKEFQTSWGLRATGEINEPTMQKLEHTFNRAREKGTVASEANKKGWQGVVGVGQKNDDVFEAERRLKKLGYDTGKVDGVFDRQTQEAVRAFKRDQKDIKNEAGALGRRGMRALGREVNELQHAPYRHRVTKELKKRERLDEATAEAAKGKSPEGLRGIGSESSKRLIANVQQHLRAAGFDPTRTDGVWNERTENALKLFQKKSGLKETGRVGSGTWGKLEQSIFAAKDGTSPAQRLGERSAAVKRSEQILKKLGHDVKVDGIFDRETQKASRAFEKRIERTGDDGAIGERQLDRMKQVLHAKEDPGEGPALKKGYRGAPVKQLQKRLEKLGFELGAQDGVFGKTTQRAVRRFQDTFGLEVDGKVTKNDWRMLGVKADGKVVKPGAVGGGSANTGSLGRRLATAARAAAMSIGGYSSQGLCATGVSKAIVNAMGVKVWGNGNQIDNNLPRDRFRQVNMSLEQALKTPGLVLTWEKTSSAAGSIYGHTAVTMGDGHTTASDFIESYTTNNGRYGLKVFAPIR